jgi:hypothetical protein
MSFNLDDYVDVAERIRMAKELYPDMRLQPANPAVPYVIEEISGQTFIVYTAAFYRDANDVLPGIGCAWEIIPGATPYTKGSELMVCETSAWGRAIVAATGMATKKIASKEEVQQARGRVERWTAADKSPEVDGWSTVPDLPRVSSDPQTGGDPKCAHGAMKWWAPKDKPDAGMWYCPLPKDAPGKCERVKA